MHLGAQIASRDRVPALFHRPGLSKGIDRGSAGAPLGTASQPSQRSFRTAWLETFGGYELRTGPSPSSGVPLSS